MPGKRGSRHWLRFGAAGLGATAAILAGLSVLAVVILRWLPPPTTAFMLQQDAPPRYSWVSRERISPHAGLAVIAAEDQRFPHHHGFDLRAISEALEDYRDGKRLRGASTISQQVAKNLFLWPGRSLLRKGIEVYFTALIELLWPKRRILEVYLNIAEFGDGLFGVEAASRRYFGKPAAYLSPAQSALLAATLPNPRRLNAARPSAYVRERQDWILGQMYGLGGTGLLRELD